MTKKIVLHPGMGAAVSAHLRQFAELPTQGILAGQAVASAIEDLWGRGGGIYNDLDVFRQCRKQSRAVTRASATATRSELSVNYCAREYEELGILSDTVETYTIESVSRDGMLNYVNCSMADGYYASRLSARHVLHGFDLNCVRVGVDLATGALYWDTHYEEFLHSRQLKIAMMHTPAHTLLRMLKKREELPDVYLDLDLTATACAAVANSKFVGEMLRDKDISLMFGHKHIQQAQRYASELEPYFSFATREFTQNGSKSAAWVERAANGEERQVILGQLLPRGAVDLSVQATVDQIGKGCLFFAYRRIEEERRQKRKHVSVKFDAVVARCRERSRHPELDPILWHAQQLGTAYVDGQALPAVSDKVHAFWTQHRGFSNKMLGLTLSQQWATITRLVDLSRRFGKEFYNGDSQAPLGVLETQARAFELQDDARLVEILKADYEEQHTPFDIKPLDLPALPPEMAHVQVRELLSPLELSTEGCQMNHCVGGYSYSVAKGRCRILSVRNSSVPNGRSTVELVWRYSHKYRREVYVVAQHRGKSNKAPVHANQLAIEYLVGVLNLDPATRSMLEQGAPSTAFGLQVSAKSAELMRCEKTLNRYKTLRRMLLASCQRLDRVSRTSLPREIAVRIGKAQHERGLARLQRGIVEQSAEYLGLLPQVPMPEELRDVLHLRTKLSALGEEPAMCDKPVLVAQSAAVSEEVEEVEREDSFDWIPF